MFSHDKRTAHVVAPFLKGYVAMCIGIPSAVIAGKLIGVY